MAGITEDDSMFIAEEIRDLIRTEHADSSTVRVSDAVDSEYPDGRRVQIVTTDETGWYLVTVQKVEPDLYYKATFPFPGV